MEIFTLLKSNIRHKKGSFISICILMTIISVSFTAFLSIRDNCEESIEKALDVSLTSDITAYISDENITDELLNRVKEHSLVEKVEQIPAIGANGQYYDDVSHTDVSNAGCLLTKYTENFQLLKDDLSGYKSVCEKPEKGKIYITQAVMTAVGCEMGDTLSMILEDRTYKYEISGVVAEPTFGSSTIGCKWFFLSDEDFDIIYHNNEECHMQILRIYQSPDSSLTDNKFRRQLNVDTGVIDKALFSITRNESLYYTNLFPSILTSVLMIFLLFLVVIVLIVIKHSISTSIESEYVNLGVLKALGFSELKIRLIFMIQYLLAQSIGVVVGFLAGIPLVNYFGNVFQGIIAIPSENKLAVLKVWIIFLGILLISTLFILISTMKVGRISPIRAIQGGRREIYFDSRIKMPITKRGLSVSLALRQFTSSKRRYVSAIIIVSILVFFMIAVNTLTNTLNSKSASEAMGIIYSECDIDFEQPEAFDKYGNEIENLINRYTEIEKKYYFSTNYYSINGENLYCMIYANPDVISMAKGRYPQYDNEIVITEFVGEELELKIGDKVTVSSNDKKSEYMITGFFQTTNDTGRCFGMNRKGAKKIDTGEIEYACYSLRDTTHCEDIKKDVNDKYGEFLTCEVTPEPSLDSLYGTAVWAMKIVIYSFSVIFALVVIVMVCKKSFLQEKTDIGIYRAVGFQIHSQRMQFAVRFLIVAICGSVIGLVLGRIFLAEVFSMLFRSIGFTSFVVIFSAEVFLMPVVLVCICFFVFSYVVSRRIKKVDIKELIME